MVFSLTDFDDLPLSSDSHGAPPVPPTSSSENQPSQATEESTSQQNSTLPVPALDPALAALSPQTSTPTQTTNPALHGEDLTQLARHLALQRSLSKHNTDELVLFAKRSLGEQLVWIAATQLLLNESVLTAFGGEVSPTLLKHIKQEVGKRILSPTVPTYKSEQLSYDLIKNALLVDQNSDVSEETLKDTDFTKKLKSAILTAWTKARSAVKTEIAQSLGDNPITELNAEGLPNRRTSSTSISQLSMDILQTVSSAKGIKFTIPLAARIAFLRYCYTLAQSSGEDYWGLVDKTLDDIRVTTKDPTAISQKFSKILTVDRYTYGPEDEANTPLSGGGQLTRRPSGSAAVAGNKRKRP